MKKWLSYSLETVKIFIVFCVCLGVFYYGIIWLNENYKGDERLRFSETDAEEVRHSVHSLLY
ncbi:DUF4227 family protein [Salibacterium salarium]|uniref:DUF4227 family protein n=1 Tax=Salibacterium salarium TaxID=284579 RepID=A0A3R9QJD5_9BACI|nr:DUF4227 family protein [Salibacterium salarium]RSL32027.1 DUF4227 family protein [Salibacterium salarium]